jgi:hypothetical protein
MVSAAVIPMLSSQGAPKARILQKNAKHKKPAASENQEQPCLPRHLTFLNLYLFASFASFKNGSDNT